MARNGYAGTSIAMICAESDCPVGSVYHHFGSKLGLLRAVLLRGRDRLLAELPSPDEAAAPHDRIVDHYRGVARVAAEHLMFLRLEVALLLQSGGDPAIRAILAELEAGWIEQTSARVPVSPPTPGWRTPSTSAAGSRRPRSASAGAGRRSSA